MITTATVRSDDPRRPRSGAGRRWLLRGLLIAGIALSGYLAWIALGEDTAAGCLGGAAGGCDDVLGSRWSRWLGLPVGFPAASLYLSMLAVSAFVEPWLPERVVRLGWILLLVMSGGLVAAAAWLIGVQAFVLEAYCPLCLTAHLVGVAVLATSCCAARLPRATIVAASAFGLLAMAAILPLGQLLGSDAGYGLERIVDHHGLEPFRFQTTRAMEAEPPAGGTARQLELLDGLVRIDLRDHPRLGSVDAPRAIVMLFDYSCQHCRRMHVYLQRYLEAHSDLAIVILPTPLSSDCNQHAPPSSATSATSESGTDVPAKDPACELARLALAVWQVDPKAFPAYHAWLFQDRRPPQLDDARQEAERLVGRSKLESVLSDGSVEIQLGQQTELYGYVGAGVLPKLLLPRAILSGVPDSARGLVRVLDDELARRDERSESEIPAATRRGPAGSAN